MIICSLGKMTKVVVHITEVVQEVEKLCCSVGIGNLTQDSSMSPERTPSWGSPGPEEPQLLGVRETNVLGIGD